MNLNDALGMLGLDSLPESESQIKRAWRAAAFVHHPDRGGSQESFTRLQRAMDVVIERMANPLADAHRAPIRPDVMQICGPASFRWVRPSVIDLRRWWREQAMLELHLAGVGHWTREGVLRDGTLPLRRKVRR